MRRRSAMLVGMSALVAAVLLLCCLPLVAADNSNLQPQVNQSIRFAVSAPLRDIAQLPAPTQYGLHLASPTRHIPRSPSRPVVDTAEQSTVGPVANYTVGLNFMGVGNGFPNYSVRYAPPDTNMAVGDTQIVQWVNVSYAVFDKANGNILAGPILGNMLWQNLGGPCYTYNDGDIIAQWDKKNHRWLLSQPVFSGPPWYTCIAVSTSADALGTYYLYQFPQGSTYFPDYPKFGVWTNGYYQSQNDFLGGYSFSGPAFCAYESAKMIVGDPSAKQICFGPTAPGDGGTIPGDIDSDTPPPANQDEFYMTIWDATHLSAYSMHVDWVNPNNSFITGANGSQLYTVAAFTPACNGQYGGACVPQLGTTDKLDVLGDRGMYRFVYYDDVMVSHATATPPIPAPLQHWYFVHDAQASGGNEAPRWYEFNAAQRTIGPTQMNLFQTGTFAPDSNYRWMGSIARDKKQNLLLGYSISSSSMYPAIGVAGRMVNDPLGTLEAEVNIISGTGSQPDTSNRWGDYSSMRIDADGCTFWYTTEYYLVTQRFDWSTQIASIKFNNCQ